MSPKDVGSISEKVTATNIGSLGRCFLQDGYVVFL